MHCVLLNSRRTFTRITQVDRILDLRLKVGNRDGFTSLFFWLVGSGQKRDGSDRVRKMDPRRTLGCFIAVPIWQQQASKGQNVEGKCNRFAVLLESVLDASRRRHCLALRRWMVMVALCLEEYRCSVESGTRVRHFAPEMCDRVPAVTLARLQT